MDDDESFLELRGLRYILSNHGVHTLQQLALHSMFALLRMDGIRAAHIPVIDSFLARHGFALTQAPDPRVRDDASRNLGRRAIDKKRPRPIRSARAL